MFTIPGNPSTQQLRGFALLQIAFFAVFAAVFVRQGRLSQEAAAVIVTASAAIGFAGALRPAWVSWYYRGWMLLVSPIGWLVLHTLLALTWYGVFTPAGIVMRLLGRDPLQRKFDPQADSYWVPRRQHDAPDRYFRQF